MRYISLFPRPPLVFLVFWAGREIFSWLSAIPPLGDVLLSHGSLKIAFLVVHPSFCVITLEKDFWEFPKLCRIITSDGEEYI